MTEAQERVVFEQAMRRFQVPIARRLDGEYLHPDARIAWFVWMHRANLKVPTQAGTPPQQP